MTVFNRVLTALLAVLVLAAATVAVIEIVLALLDQPLWLVPHEDWSAWLRETPWFDLAVRAILAGVLLLGLLLLLAALRRGKPATLPLSSSTEGVRFTASRRSVEKVIAASARRTEGVGTADADARGRRVTVTASTPLREAGDLQQRVSSAVQQRLDDLGLSGTLRPSVRVSRKEGR